MPDSIKQLAEHKLIILHLVQKMGIALSNSEICQFLLSKNYMDYFSVQQYLAELTDTGWLEKSREQNSTRYTLTDEGEEIINYFMHHIPEDVKNEINTYVHDNSKRIRAEYAVTANYFPELNGDFLVKCVVSKEQAQQICRNWRKQVNRYYRSILTSLAAEDAEEPKAEEQGDKGDNEEKSRDSVPKPAKPSSP